jgi:Leucine-rich repeat (LRR) protein
MLSSLFGIVSSRLESWGLAKHRSSHLSHAETNLFLSRIYHEAPNDVFELMVSKFSNGWGGMNELRLVNKRCMRAVMSCATRLSCLRIAIAELEAFPRWSIDMEHGRIQHILCNCLKSLDGCPKGLKSLDIGFSRSIRSLEPLRGCEELEVLVIQQGLCIFDLNPLASLTKIKKLIVGNSQVSDLSPLSSMSLLAELNIFGCSSIQSLDPLSGLINLQHLNCFGIDPKVSLLPLASCTGLKELVCSKGAADLHQMKKIPQLEILQL